MTGPAKYAAARAKRSPARQGEARAGKIKALFGRETNYVFRLYLQRIFIFTAVALAVVLSLDVASNIAFVMSKSLETTGLNGPARLAYYALLRAGYVLPSILPIAGIIGVVWAEYGLAISRERIMIFNSGRAHMLSLVPAALVGLLVGLMQFAALGYLRPAAVEGQGTSTYRYYGPKFDRPVVTRPKWISTKDAFVYARIDIDTGVTLREVIGYRLNNRGKLESIISATFAVPAKTDGNWEFHNGSLWEFTSVPTDSRRLRRMEETHFEVLEQKLLLNQLWVENIEIQAVLLPQSILSRLASEDQFILNTFNYQTAYQERFASILYSVGMTLLGAFFALLTFSPKMNPSQALKVGIWGAGAHIGSSILVMLGNYGNLPAFLAAWAMPLIIVSSLLYLAYRHNKGVHLKVSDGFRRLPNQSPLQP
ncbi:MAG: LptF/LptG family permease [Fimbriimonadaceae bacterium]|nr:LptF/LptG family permease [Alphaproteobacteria bacterium]